MTKEQDHKKLRSHKIKMKNLAIMHKGIFALLNL